MLYINNLIRPYSYPDVLIIYKGNIMIELNMKPVMVVPDTIFNNIEDYKHLLDSIYGNGFSVNDLDNPMVAKEIEVNLTLLLNKLTRNELEAIIYNGDTLMRTINKQANYGVKNNDAVGNFILRSRGVRKIYNKVIGIINERLNKNAINETKESVMLDLKNRYSSLASKDVVELRDFSVIKIDAETFDVLNNTVASDSKFNFAYGMFINTNSIASNIDLNNTKIKIADSLLPYIRSYA